MNKTALIAVLALAACGQSTAPEPEAAAAPQALMDQAQRMAADRQPVFAWQQLTAYQQAHPESQPPCASIRRAESRGVIPTDVAADSFYAAHTGALVFSIQCGPQLTATREEPREHWLVVLAPGAMEAAIVNCADARGQDQCPPFIPRTIAP